MKATKMKRASLLIIIMALVLAGCTGQEATSPDEIVYGLTLKPSGFDPHRNLSAELGIPLSNVYDTLVARDPETMQIVPHLATDWTISEDGLSWTFNLRQDVKFHDGTAFNAAAVAANLERILSPEIASQKAQFLLGLFESYEVRDVYTIQLNFSEPYAPVLDALSTVYLGMASPTALQEHTPDTYQFNQVGSGPYRFIELIPGDRLVLEANPDYAWAPAFVQNKGEPYIKRIVFRFYEDPPSRALALESGDVHVMGELLPTDAQALAASDEIDLHPVAVSGIPLQFMMNTQKFPTENLTFRQALLYGTNRRAIVDTIFGGFSPPACGPISANMPFFDPSVCDLYEYDFGEARRMLNDIGFIDYDEDDYLDFDPDGEDGPNEPWEITLTMVVPPWGLLDQVAQMVQDQWRTLGIRLELVTVPSFPALVDAALDGDYHLIAMNDMGTDPVIINPFYLPGGIRNWSNYEDEELERFLIDGARSTDDETRAMFYASAQQYIMDRALILPIRDYVNLNGTTSALAGVRYRAFGFWPILPDFRFGPPDGS